MAAAAAFAFALRGDRDGWGCSRGAWERRRRREVWEGVVEVEEVEDDRIWASSMEWGMSRRVTVGEEYSIHDDIENDYEYNNDNVAPLTRSAVLRVFT